MCVCVCVCPKLSKRQCSYVYYIKSQYRGLVKLCRLRLRQAQGGHAPQNAYNFFFGHLRQAQGGHAPRLRTNDGAMAASRRFDPTHAHTHTHLHTYTHIHIHTYTHTHTHTHTHTRTRSLSLSLSLSLSHTHTHTNTHTPVVQDHLRHLR